ncbi:MAG: cytidylate kinase-like family protein [Clostridiales bacterium]|nr:cytidylate kinase-like family protein [Candidatus Crickella merdequi]
MDKKKTIVTIAREFGSGGHEIGQKLAMDLGLKFYDNELICKAAEKTGYHEDYIRDNEEKAPSYTISSVFSAVDVFQSSPFDKIQIEEHRLIEELGEEGDCVIVGRGADYILQDTQHVSIFIFAPIEDRLERIKMNQEKYHVEQALPSDAVLLKQIKQVDKQRRRYYEFYTDNKWGARDVYDLLINTSKTGIDGAVKIIETYIKESRDKNLLSD